jgi:hypothetical protein
MESVNPLLFAVFWMGNTKGNTLEWLAACGELFAPKGILKQNAKEATFRNTRASCSKMDSVGHQEVGDHPLELLTHGSEKISPGRKTENKPNILCVALLGRLDDRPRLLQELIKGTLGACYSKRFTTL